ncbi:hypothetical protein VRK_12390 [Vibrio sp. MEBiC08052]|nr:hypothetical protein VRK_12390 [Vibrio sp. MEBiC08052]
MFNIIIITLLAEDAGYDLLLVGCLAAVFCSPDSSTAVHNWYMHRIDIGAILRKYIQTTICHSISV